MNSRSNRRPVDVQDNITDLEFYLSCAQTAARRLNDQGYVVFFNPDRKFSDIEIKVMKDG